MIPLLTNFAVLDSMSGVFGHMGAGMAALSMDKEFKSARTKRRQVCGLLCVREREKREREREKEGERDGQGVQVGAHQAPRGVRAVVCERDPLFKFRKNAPLIISGFNWPRGIIGPN